MDISSEMIHALLPVYLVTVLGTSILTVGIIEGVAEAAAMITKVFSGALSDWLGKRKLLAAIGYGLAAFLAISAGTSWHGSDPPGTRADVELQSSSKSYAHVSRSLIIATLNARLPFLFRPF